MKHTQIGAVLAKVLLTQTLVRTVNYVYMTAARWLKSQKRQRISLGEHKYILQRDRCTDTTLPSPGESRKTISRGGANRSDNCPEAAWHRGSTELSSPLLWPGMALLQVCEFLWWISQSNCWCHG